MSHAIVEKKYMCMMPPRAGSCGAMVANPAGVVVADLTAFCNGPEGGDAYAFFQADGGDLYIMTAPTVGAAGQINPGSNGVPTRQGSPGGSTQPQAGMLGICARLPANVPLRYILEPNQDMYLGFVMVNPSGPVVTFRYWQASMTSNA